MSAFDPVPCRVHVYADGSLFCYGGSELPMLFRENEHTDGGPYVRATIVPTALHDALRAADRYAALIADNHRLTRELAAARDVLGLWRALKDAEQRRDDHAARCVRRDIGGMLCEHCSKVDLVLCEAAAALSAARATTETP